jgi:dTMP kinase
MQVGRLVTFEGIDGCGKSTQVKLFSEKMKKLGHRVILFREPGGTVIGEGLRKLLKNGENAAEAELFMLAAARAQLVKEVILPSLEAGFMVVGDRFLDSTYAYQQYGRGVDPALVKSVVEGSTGGVEPAISFFIDVPVELADRRIRTRGGSLDSFEKRGRGFFTEVRNGYLRRCSEVKSLVTIDGTGGEEEVSRRVMDAWSEAEGIAPDTCVTGHVQRFASADRRESSKTI